MGGGILERLDRWNERGKWMPEREEWFPAKVFWGFFAWNFPFLLAAFAAIWAMARSISPDPSGGGVFTSMNWVAEMAIGSVGFGALVDLLGCLWVRRLWNKRARELRDEDEAE